MKKFTKMLENVGNVYQKGTPFSNGHRSKTNKNGFLEDRHLMIDIDAIIVDSSDKIISIVEKKKQTPGKDSKLKNILDPNIVTSQKIALLELCRILDCKLYVHIENEKNYYLLKSDFSTKVFTEQVIKNAMKEKGLRLIETDNIIFLEFRQNYRRVQFKGIFERAGSSEILYKYMDQISQVCGQIPTVQVDDTMKEIQFRVKGKLIGTVPSVLYPQYADDVNRLNLENKWSDIWKSLGLWI